MYEKWGYARDRPAVNPCVAFTWMMTSIDQSSPGGHIPI